MLFLVTKLTTVGFLIVGVVSEFVLLFVVLFRVRPVDSEPGPFMTIKQVRISIIIVSLNEILVLPNNS